MRTKAWNPEARAWAPIDDVIKGGSLRQSAVPMSNQYCQLLLLKKCKQCATHFLLAPGIYHPHKKPIFLEVDVANFLVDLLRF